MVDARLADAAPPPGTEAFDLVLASGDTVHAWYRRAASAVAPTVLFLHGARRNLYESQFRIDRLADLGLNVLAIDYRGFGRSTPLLPSEETALQDARAAFDELRRRQPDPRRRFLYGYSLGGAVAIALAAERDGVAGVIVESSFTSIAELVRASRWGWVPFLGAAVTQELLANLVFHWGHGFIESGPYGPHRKKARYYLAESPAGEVSLPVSEVLGHPEHEEFRWVDAAAASQLLNRRMQGVLAWVMMQMEA